VEEGVRLAVGVPDPAARPRGRLRRAVPREPRRARRTRCRPARQARPPLARARLVLEPHALLRIGRRRRLRVPERQRVRRVARREGPRAPRAARGSRRRLGRRRLLSATRPPSPGTSRLDEGVDGHFVGSSCTARAATRMPSSSP
jgi:hypothetical protein